MSGEYLPLEHFQGTDDDFSTSRIRDMPYGKQREALTLYPQTLYLGAMVLGRISPPEIVLLSNVGYDRVPITDITVVGDFMFAGPEIDRINTGEVISLNIAFIPVVIGPATGGLYIHSPNAIGMKFVTLIGSGVETEENLMEYSLLRNGNATGVAISISNGVYAFQVAGVPDGAVASLQWRSNATTPWIDIPNAILSTVDTIYGIPLNNGQARAVIKNSSTKTSLTVTLMW